MLRTYSQKRLIRDRGRDEKRVGEKPRESMILGEPQSQPDSIGVLWSTDVCLSS